MISVFFFVYEPKEMLGNPFPFRSHLFYIFRLLPRKRVIKSCLRSKSFSQSTILATQKRGKRFI